jgi:hypothetical protein
MLLVVKKFVNKFGLGIDYIDKLPGDLMVQFGFLAGHYCKVSRNEKSRIWRGSNSKRRIWKVIFIKKFI